MQYSNFRNEGLCVRAKPPHEHVLNNIEHGTQFLNHFIKLPYLIFHNSSTSIIHLNPSFYFYDFFIFTKSWKS